MSTFVLVTGGFDPLHSGHIAYFKAAKQLAKYGGKFWVGVNSDEWLQRKKGKPFMTFDERKSILQAIKYVDEVIHFEDDKKGSCINAIKKIKKSHPNDKIFFANGGDRNKHNIPEMSVAGIEFLFGVGGSDKKNSSSWILNNWQYYFEERQWGSFLIVEPKKSMSFQRHLKRNEIWLVSEGECEVKSSDSKTLKNSQKVLLKKFDYFIVPLGQWHQIINSTNKQTHIIEIQYGDECIEDDIERI